MILVKFTCVLPAHDSARIIGRAVTSAADFVGWCCGGRFEKASLLSISGLCDFFDLEFVAEADADERHEAALGDAVGSAAGVGEQALAGVAHAEEKA